MPVGGRGNCSHIRGLRLGWLAALTVVAGALEGQVTITREIAAPGSSVVATLGYNAPDSFLSGLQFDLEYDGSALGLAMVTREAVREAGKSLYVRALGPNRQRILVVGLNQEPIPRGRLAELFFYPRADAANREYPVVITNAMGTDGFGRAVSVPGSAGAIVVQAGLPVVRLRAEGVLSAASLMGDGVSPGEILTLLGAQIGAPEPQTPSAGGSSQILGDTIVRFDGIPAPLLYSSPNQINLVAPYAVAARARVNVEVSQRGIIVGLVSVPVLPARPALFTINGGGFGPGAILNQDATLNTDDRPAEVGSVAVLFATGAGQTNPGGVDGQVAGQVLPRPVGSVGLTVGGRPAEVLYAGAAPGAIAGLLQVNFRIPEGTPRGAVPVTLRVGQATSPSAVTVWVR